MSVRPEAGVSGRSWWQRPWVGPLALVAVLFVAISVPRYLTFDPSQSMVQPEPFVGYYPLLVAHVLLGAVAMLTCCLQVWPWFRAGYPLAHRWIGRIYVFGGALPSGVLALVLGAVSPLGAVSQVSTLLLSVLWLGCTVAGYRMARARRFDAHRKWMIRSFVLTMSIATNRIWGVVFGIALAPELETTFGGNEQYFAETFGGLASWTGWVVPLLISQWWLERRPRRARATARLRAG